MAMVVVRYVGPKGGPGMPEMLSLSFLIRKVKGVPLNWRPLLRRKYYGLLLDTLLRKLRMVARLPIFVQAIWSFADQDTKEISMAALTYYKTKYGRTTIPPLYSRGVGKYAHMVSLPLKVCYRLLETEETKNSRERIKEPASFSSGFAFYFLNVDKSVPLLSRPPRAMHETAYGWFSKQETKHPTEALSISSIFLRESSDAMGDFSTITGRIG